LQFIAPEAIISKRNIEPIVDVFSWAAAALHLIGGDNSRTISHNLREDDENNPPEFYSAVHAHSTRTPQDLSTLRLSIPPELSAIVRKARSLDPEDRYQTVSALLHDLNKVHDICSGKLRGKERENFCAGHADDRSRFKIPPGMLDRKEEYAQLDRVFELVKDSGTSQVACCWGTSGSGKSKLLETWARAKEGDIAGGQDVLIGWAKVSEMTG
jgi:serine/threonine protein kinase